MPATAPTRSLSRVEARVILGLEEDGRSEVTMKEIGERASVGRPYARALAHRLARKGWLQRLGGGRYLVNPGRHGPDAMPDTDPLRFGSRLVRPYYFAYASAAELWGLLPQAGRVYYVASPRRVAARTTHPAQFRFVRVAPARFFGITDLRRRGEVVRVSDPEKTVLDSLDRPELSGGLGGIVQTLATAKPRLDWERLHRYVRRWGNRSLANRLGYLAEIVRPSVAPPTWWSDRMRPTRSDPYVPLDPSRRRPRTGAYDSRWRLIRNVPDRELFAEARLR